jgi:hypothetical protein
MAAQWLSGATAAGRAVITPAQVVKAMNDAGMKVTSEQVTLLSDAVAKTATPLLRVESMEPWGEHRMRVRLVCASSDQCLPFLVSVYSADQSAVRPVIAHANPSSAGMTPVRPLPSSYVVRAGSVTKLLIEGKHVHIEVPVICLENGTAGQTIRVASSDRRQTYNAEVVDSTLLRSRL